MNQPTDNGQERVSVGHPGEQQPKSAIHDANLAQGKEARTAVSAAQHSEISQGGEEDVGQHEERHDADHGQGQEERSGHDARTGEALADGPKSVEATAPTDDQQTNAGPGFDKGRNGLLQLHADLLARYGIGIKTQQARGYRSVTDRADLAGLGFSAEQCRVPSLVSPILDANGKKDTPRSFRQSISGFLKTVWGF